MLYCIVNYREDCLFIITQKSCLRDRSLFMPKGGLEEIKGGGALIFFWSDEGGGLQEKNFLFGGGGL